MQVVRYWCTSHARFLERVYAVVEWTVLKLSPLWRKIGYERLDAPLAALERVSKGFLFDCRMCGNCVLTSTGMTCPMNCPKTLRNGPCGGVRDNGYCEVKPEMRCVWVEAVRGAEQMHKGQLINLVQLPVDGSAKGRSAWVQLLRERAQPNAQPQKGCGHAV